jgi:hypothetical protein
MSDREQRTEDGEATLDALSYGDDIPAIKMAALDAARKLYGHAARLQIEGVGTIRTAVLPDKGEFCAWVTVRCLDGGAS